VQGGEQRPWERSDENISHAKALDDFISSINEGFLISFEPQKGNQLITGFRVTWRRRRSYDHMKAVAQAASFAPPLHP